MHIQVYGSWFSVNEQAILPRWLHKGKLRRLSCGLRAEVSRRRHDLKLAELNNTAVGVSVGLRRAVTYCA